MIICGKLTIKIDNEIIRELKIFAKNDVPKKKIFDYFKDFIKVGEKINIQKRV